MIMGGMKSLRHVAVIPRRSRCIIILVFLVLFQLCSLFLYSLSEASTANEDNAILSQLDNFDFNSARTFIKSWFKSPIEEEDFRKTLESTVLEQIDLQDSKYWKFQNKLINTELKLTKEQFLKKRQLLLYDPRLTYSVYLNYIKTQFAKNNNEQSQSPSPSPSPEENTKVVVPFDWSDWVDLSILNQYIAIPPEERPTCELLYPNIQPATRGRRKKVDGHPIPPEAPDQDTSKKTETKVEVNKYCLNDAQYLEQQTGKEETLASLPGFNVYQSGPKGSWDKKIIQAKSFLYSSFPPPSSIVFLSEEGIYEVFPDQTKRTRLTNSDLLQQYLIDNDLLEAEQIDLNPIVEFQKLRQAIPAQSSSTLDEMLLQDPNARLHLNHSMFVYDHDKIINEYESMIQQQQTPLTTKQQSHYEALKYSKSISSLRLSKHFQEVAIQGTTPNTKESGAHFDWRFFNGFVSLSKLNDIDDVAEKKRIILHRLLKTWLQFTYRTNIITWIAHGSLLSWYWDGISFPWDVDIDVQMPIMELDRFALMYNNSLVVENVEEGYGKFFVDCSSFLTHRTRGNGRNNIDARFIDADSGFYIDITGLSLTNTQVSDRYRGKLVPEEVDKIVTQLREEKTEKQQDSGDAEEVKPNSRKANEKKATGVSTKYAENLSLQAYNCRNNHFYRLSELSPLRISLIEGTKTLIPNNIKDILKAEYTRGMSVTTFNKHVYIPQLRLWLPFESVYSVLKEEVEAINARTSKKQPKKKTSTSQRVTAAKIIRLMKEIDEKMVIKLLSNQDILKEYYLTHDITKLHQLELDQINAHGNVDRDFLIENVISKHFDPLRKDMFVFKQQVTNQGDLLSTLPNEDTVKMELLDKYYAKKRATEPEGDNKVNSN